MDRFRLLWIAARVDHAFLAPCAVFVGSSYARFDSQPGPGLPAHIVVSWAALFAAAGANLVDHLRCRPGPDAARDVAIAASAALIASLIVGGMLVPLSGIVAVGFGVGAVAIAILAGATSGRGDARSRWWGLLARSLALGPLAVLAGFASQCGQGSIGATLVGIPVGVVAASALGAEASRDPVPGEKGRIPGLAAFVAAMALVVLGVAFRLAAD